MQFWCLWLCNCAGTHWSLMADISVNSAVYLELLLYCNTFCNVCVIVVKLLNICNFCNSLIQCLNNALRIMWGGFDCGGMIDCERQCQIIREEKPKQGLFKFRSTSWRGIFEEYWAFISLKSVHKIFYFYWT